MGTYDCQIPMPINGRLRGIDYCLADLVAALNASNLPTIASCCGHGQIDGNITLEDGRVLMVTGHVRPWEKAEHEA